MVLVVPKVASRICNRLCDGWRVKVNDVEVRLSYKHIELLGLSWPHEGELSVCTYDLQVYLVAIGLTELATGFNLELVP